MIRPVPPKPIRLGGGSQEPSERPFVDPWRNECERVQALFQIETMRTSKLVTTLHAMGCRAAHAHPDCPGCQALKVVGALDPATTSSAGVELPNEIAEREHPERTCARCGGPNIVWTAPSPLWNEVMRSGSINGDELHDGVVCPICFAQLAEAAGVAEIWRLNAERVHVPLETITPSGRVWDETTWLWSEPTPETRRHARTGHGHPCCKYCPIGDPPRTVFRCGGPRRCEQCAEDRDEIHATPGVTRDTGPDGNGAYDVDCPVCESPAGHPCCDADLNELATPHVERRTPADGVTGTDGGQQ